MLGTEKQFNSQCKNSQFLLYITSYKSWSFNEYFSTNYKEDLPYYNCEEKAAEQMYGPKDHLQFEGPISVFVCKIWTTTTILESQEWSVYTGLTVLNLFLRLLVFYYLRYITSERLYFPGWFNLFKQRKILDLSPEAKDCRRWRDIRQGPARCQSWWGRRLEGSGRKKEAFAPPEKQQHCIWRSF